MKVSCFHRLIEHKKGNIVNLNSIQPQGPHTIGFIRFASEVREGERVQVNRFEVLSRHHQSTDVGDPKLAPHPIAEQLLALESNKHGIKVIPIKLLFDEPDANLSARYDAYDSNLNRLVCAGDGDNFRRTSFGQDQTTQTTSGACLGPDACAFAQGGDIQCRLRVKLKAQIDGQDDQFSVFEFQSGSINTYRALAAKITMMHATFGRKLRHVPLNLKMWTKSSMESLYEPFFCADIALRESETMASACKAAIDGALGDGAANLAISALNEVAKTMSATQRLSMDSSETYDEVITFTPTRMKLNSAERRTQEQSTSLADTINLARANAPGIASTVVSHAIAKPLSTDADTVLTKFNAAPERLTSQNQKAEIPPTPI